MVYEELRKIIINIKIAEITRYFKFHSRICDVMEAVLDKCLTPTNEIILNLIEIENAHINTNHPDFVTRSDAIMNLFQPVEEVRNLGERRQEHFSIVEEKQKEEEAASVKAQ